MALRSSSTMLSMINRVLDWIRSLFWKEEMELTLVGLQNSGKTTFVNVIAVSTPKLLSQTSLITKHLFFVFVENMMIRLF